MIKSEPEAARSRERRTMPAGEGRSVAWTEAGQGRDVVLIHGALVNADDMRIALIPSLADAFRVVAFDRPGHGLSERSRANDASLWRQAAILRKASAALGLRRPILVGHSFGGAVALAWAMAFPDEVAGVVALAPICFPEPRLEHLLFAPRAVPLAGDILAQVLHAASDPVLLPTLWRSMFLPQAMPEAFARGFSFDLAGHSAQTVREGEGAAALFADLSRSVMAYPACRVPVRFLCGDADIVVNNHLHARGAAALIPGAAFEWIGGVGHMVHHVCTDRVVETVRSLAAAVDRGRK